MGTGARCRDDVTPAGTVQVMFVSDFLSNTHLSEPSSHLPFSELRERKLTVYSDIDHVWMADVWQEGIAPPSLRGRAWKLVFPLQVQVDTLSLYVKAMLSHGHGHLCGDPGNGDHPKSPQRDGKRNLETQIWGGQ